MAQFQEYPKKMSHPQYQPAQWKKLEGKGTGLFEPDTIMTSPERFPEVTVMTVEQEQQYAARGYRPNNVADPLAYEQAILEAAPVAGYLNNEYPKWKYHAMEIPVIVKDAAEEAALGDEWGDRPIIATEDDICDPETVDIVPPASTLQAAPSASPAPAKQARKPAAKKTAKRSTKPRTAAKSAHA